MVVITSFVLRMCMFSCFLFVFRQLDADIKEDFLVRIGDVFGVERSEALQLYNLLLQCMEHRESVSKTTFVIVCVVIQHMDYSHSFNTSLNNR